MRASLRRFETRRGCPAGVIAGRAASREVRCRSECCYAQSLRGCYRIPRFRLAFAVSGDACGLSLHAVPRDIAIPGSSSRRLHASSECYRSEPAPGLPARSSSLGIRAVPSSRHQSQVSDTMGFQAHRPSVRDVFHVLDGFSHPKPCGFISPRCHVQGSPSRGLFLPHSRTGSSPARLPSRRWRRSTTTSCPVAPSHAAPPSGLYSVRESAICASVLPIAPIRFPSWAFLLQVLRLPAAAKRVTVPRPLTTLASAWPTACCRLGARHNSCESRRPARGFCLPSPVARRATFQVIRFPIVPTAGMPRP